MSERALRELVIAMAEYIAGRTNSTAEVRRCLSALEGEAAVDRAAQCPKCTSQTRSLYKGDGVWSILCEGCGSLLATAGSLAALRRCAGPWWPNEVSQHQSVARPEDGGQAVGLRREGPETPREELKSPTSDNTSGALLAPPCVCGHTLEYHHGDDGERACVGAIKTGSGTAICPCNNYKAGAGVSSSPTSEAYEAARQAYRVVTRAWPPEFATSPDHIEKMLAKVTEAVWRAAYRAEREEGD